MHVWIICVHNAPLKLRDSLWQEWARCDARTAFEKLSQPDVVVTNQSDKDMQLPKILLLDEQVRRDAPASLTSHRSLSDESLQVAVAERTSFPLRVPYVYLTCRCAR